MPGQRKQQDDTQQIPPFTPFIQAPLACLLTGILLNGCAPLPGDYARPESAAFPDYPATTVGRFFGHAAGWHPDQSGFMAIRKGHDAFTSRITMTELAEKSIDVQC